MVEQERVLADQRREDPLGALRQEDGLEAERSRGGHTAEKHAVLLEVAAAQHRAPQRAGRSALKPAGVDREAGGIQFRQRLDAGASHAAIAGLVAGVRIEIAIRQREEPVAVRSPGSEAGARGGLMQGRDDLAQLLADPLGER